MSCHFEQIHLKVKMTAGVQLDTFESVSEYILQEIVLHDPYSFFYMLCTFLR